VDALRYQQVKAVLIEALALPTGERPLFLSKTCGADAGLRAEVEALLRYEPEPDFLEPPVLQDTDGELDIEDGGGAPDRADALRVGGRLAAPVTVVVTTSPETQAAENALTEAVALAFADLLSTMATLGVVHVSAGTLEAGERSPERLALPGSTRTALVRVECARLAQDRMRVATTTTDPGDGQVLDEWSLEGPSHDLPGLLERIASAVTAGLGVTGNIAEGKIASDRPFDTEAYLALIEGRRNLLIGGKAGSTKAFEVLERSIASAPAEAALHAAFVEACIGLVEQDCAVDRDAIVARARVALKQATALGPAAPDVLYARAETAYRLDWSLADAERQLREILSVRPAHLRARLRLAECLISTGRAPEAAALALDVADRLPDSASVLLRAGRVLHFARAYDDAVRVFEAALRSTPNSAVARLDLALTYAATGDCDRAYSECDRALASADGQGMIAAALGNAARSRGDDAIHQAAGRFIAGLDMDPPRSSCCLAILDAAFGNTHRPLEYWDPYDESMGLAKFAGLAPVPGSLSMFVSHVGLIAYFDINPWFGCLRRAPAVQALLGRLGGSR
jgi:tetratricopeptide (TPR) repeat protein